MARGDISVTVMLPVETEEMLSELARYHDTTRREVVMQAIKLLAKKSSPKEARRVKEVASE